MDQTGSFLMVEEPGSAAGMKTYMPRNKGGAPTTPGKSEKLKAVAEMRAKDMSLRDIADAVGISEAGVRKWLKELNTNAN